jgi:hypothetical protein
MRLARTWLALWVTSACGTDSVPQPPPDVFEADPPAVYVAKV